MTVHHLNCGSLRRIDPAGDGTAGDGTAGDGTAGDPASGTDVAHRGRPAVCHCLLVETAADGLVLVETGLGTGDLRSPGASLGADWVAYAQPALDPAEPAVRQVVALGYAPEDVRHVVLTHLHRDHTGGLPDFPDAQIHVHADELAAVTEPDHPHHRHSAERFMPAHRAHHPRLVAVPAGAREHVEWFGMRGVVRVQQLAHDVLLVPLPGHSAGHAGVAVRDGDGRWLLHAGDAYMYHGELDRTPPQDHPVLDAIQQGAQTDAATRLATRERLRRLRRESAGRVTVFSAHDPWEFAGLARQP